MNAHDDQIRLEQAAAWRSRLGDSDGAVPPELAAWLAADPRNREAWQHVQAPWQLLGEHAAAPALIRLRRSALAHAHHAARTADAARPNRRRWAAVAGFALAAVAAGLVLIARGRAPQVFDTGAGERRIVTLGDGSQITLDVQSEVRVRYTADARSLTLVRGRARFDVAHDLTRPFTVAAEKRKVVATGTAFDVALPGNEMLVTLIKGHVVVLPRNAPTRPFGAADAARAAARGATTAAATDSIPADWSRIDLDPGEQLVLSATAAPRIQRVDLDDATAWERGEIVFKDEPLASVIAQVNRYGSRPIIVADSRAAQLRISGVFRTGDVDGFVDTIASYLPVRRETLPDGSIELRAR